MVEEMEALDKNEDQDLVALFDGMKHVGNVVGKFENYTNQMVEKLILM